VREYELVFIVHPDVEEVDPLLEKVTQFITSGGGQVVKTERWGKRRLAYPIRKQKEGYYVLMQIQLQPEAVRELERNLRLTEGILRHLVVRVEKK